MHRFLELVEERVHQGGRLLLLQGPSQQPFSLLTRLLHSELLHLLIISLQLLDVPGAIHTLHPDVVQDQRPQNRGVVAGGMVQWVGV